MRPIGLKRGVREGRQVLGGALRLVRTHLAATVELGLVLALLPALLKALMLVRANGQLLGVWEGWIEAVFIGASAENPVALISMTLRQSGVLQLGISLLDLAKSLVLQPLLLSALALLYNGFIRQSDRMGIDAARTAAQRVKDLILVALACMVAVWFVQMIPSLANGILSLLADLLSWIPVLGDIATVLAVVLSLLVSLATDFAVVVIFCYVWISAACEGVSGFGSLVRSWQLMRNALHQTISALLGLTLLRWVVIIILALLWLFAGRAVGLPISSLVYAFHAVSAIYTVLMGAVTSVLYQQRPMHPGPRPDQFQRRPSLENMKRANID